MKVDLKDAEVNLSKVQEEKDYVDVLREILNDKGAGTNKQKVCTYYECLINKYLQAWTSIFHLIQMKSLMETVKSRFRDTFNYNNFSEGEKMRIDLALLFTWRDIARMKNSTTLIC